MTTPSEQIRAWTIQGSQDAAANTYQAVKAALESAPEMTAHDYEVFLQGSYANATNTRGDSDVDIVVMMTSTFMPDLSRLSPVEVQRHAAARIPGTTSTWEFRRSVETALRRRFDVVDSRDKCLFIPQSAGRVDADVVPAIQRRVYVNYPAYGSPDYIEGVEIRPLTGGSIVNFPKQHLANGRRKNHAASLNYKKTVRQVKRLRRSAVDKGLLGPNDAPGYVLECMVYNAPNDLFVSDDVDRLIKVMAWLGIHDVPALRRMKSCDEIHTLFNTDPGRHSAETAAKVIRAMWEIL